MAEAELTGRDLDEALAKALGYEYIDAPARLNDAGVLGKLWHSPDGRWRLDGLPVFHRSLNAMHEVETEIERRGLSERYVSRLFYVIDPTGGFVADERWSLTHAAAEQRARAALDVLTQVKEGGE